MIAYWFRKYFLKFFMKKKKKKLIFFFNTIFIFLIKIVSKLFLNNQLINTLKGDLLTGSFFYCEELQISQLCDDW